MNDLLYLKSCVPKMRLKEASLCNIPCTLTRRDGLVASSSFGTVSICIKVQHSRKGRQGE